MGTSNGTFKNRLGSNREYLALYFGKTVGEQYVPSDNSDGGFKGKLLSCLKSLAFCFIAAVRVGTGAANIYFACCAFT